MVPLFSLIRLELCSSKEVRGSELKRGVKRIEIIWDDLMEYRFISVSIIIIQHCIKKIMQIRSVHQEKV